MLAGDRLVLTASDGVALAVSPYTGEILGRQDVLNPVRLPPIVADETMYLLTTEAELIALH